MTPTESSQTDARHIRLKIYTNPGDNFHAQLDLVKSSGAGWDAEGKAWILWIGPDPAADATRLATLFQAARDYGTTVIVNEP